MEPILQIIDRYGFATGMLFVLVVAVWKGFWPAFIQMISETRQLLLSQLKASDERLDRTNVEFLKALRERDEIMKESFEHLHARLDRDQGRNPRR